MRTTEFQKSGHSSFQSLTAPAPSAPPVNRSIITDRRFGDPSSTISVASYPIPSFFDYRIKSRTSDI